MILTGKEYREMVISAACCMDNNKETVNSLNVFPVPDGDTGINMSLTIGGVRSELPEEAEGIGDMAQKAANIMLRGARGNSGVILSLFFRGLAKAWKGLETADEEAIVAGVMRGVKEAYRAVMNPTEGTILTVMRVMGETAEKAVSDGVADNLEKLFYIMKEAAKETLDTTPDLLPQLKQAGVVDSGGYGFVCVMEGMLKALQGEPVVALNNDSGESTGADFSEFDTSDIKYAYCTECIVTKSDIYAGEGTCGELHKFIMSMGDSAVFVDDEEIVKLHIHTNAPGAVLTEALRYGSLYTVKIENMKRQHSALSGGADTEAKKPSPVKEEAAEPERKSVEITKKYGFVTVCMGDGLTEMFHDLQADVVVSGGQTMNPSTDDILSAIESTPAENVFVLPNNKNICMVCQQAKRLVEDRNVIVIETVSVPEGTAAMLAFNEEAEVEENTEEMKAAADNVTTVSVTYAVRDTEVGDNKIHEGDTLGLVNGKIITSHKDRSELLKKLIKKTERESADYITVSYGEGATEEEAEEVAALYNERYPDAEVITLCGGQPVYSYIISLE